MKKKQSSLFRQKLGFIPTRLDRKIFLPKQVAERSASKKDNNSNRSMLAVYTKETLKYSRVARDTSTRPLE